MSGSPELEMNAHALVRYLKKMPADFTKADIVRYIEENGVKRVNFRYVGGDGRLKTLNFVVTSRAHLEKLLSAGERVDGSSLFPNLRATGSDLYVVPRYRTAFLNPFACVPTVDILCSYFDPEGRPFACSPENILHAAHDALKKQTGLTMYAMGELEFYAIAGKHALYPMKPQKGYKESQPFSKMENLRCEAMEALAQAGCLVKYGHNEVGSIQDDERYLEQNEIEFIPVPLEDAADQIALGRWVVRMVGQKYGVTASFAPKIAMGHAGSGLHIHMMLVKDGKNEMFRGGRLSETAKKAIAGFLTMTPSLTSFGNIVPTSYLRLVPNQEAPTGVFWGERNRMALIRVPLGWQGTLDMARHVNPKEDGKPYDASENATVEFRCPDGSADIYLLLAGLAVAAREGLRMDNALQIADRLYVAPGTHPSPYEKTVKGLPHIPRSCHESAENLIRDRAIYERDGVFPPEIIDSVAERLKAFDDKELKLYNKTNNEIRKFMDEYLHCA